MKDLKEKVSISTGVLGHVQQLTYDAHGLNPILAAESVPFFPVGWEWAMGLLSGWETFLLPLQAPNLSTLWTSWTSPPSRTLCQYSSEPPKLMPRRPILPELNRQGPWCFTNQEFHVTFCARARQNRTWHEREAALLSWAHCTQPGR